MPDPAERIHHHGLGQLPGDWEVARFGEVFKMDRRSVQVDLNATYTELGIRSHGNGVFHKDAVTGAAIGKKRVFSVRAERLIFNIIFAWERAVAVTGPREEGLIASHRFPMFRPVAPAKVDVEFCRRFLLTDRGARLLGVASPGGAGRNRTLSQKALSEIPIPIPPLGEQRKIASILSSIDAVIDKTEAVIDQLQIVKNALMQELLTRGVPGRHTRFKKTEIGRVPESWRALPVRDVLINSKYGTSRKCDSSSEGHPVLRIPNVASGRISTDSLKYADMPRDEVERYRLEPGDVLLVRTNGNPDFVGRTAVFDGLDGTWLYASYLIRLRAVSEIMLPEFLHLTLQRRQSRAKMRNGVRTSAGNYNVNSKGVGATVVAIPPIEEQVELNEVMAKCEARIDAEQHELAVLTRTRSALMSVLLTGEVRVQPDEEVA